MGIPVDGLTFDPAIAVRGLIVDASKGNLLKVDRFGLVKRAMHGSKMLAPLDVQKEYGRELVQLSDTSRWFFLNTLFSVSEGCLFMQVRAHGRRPLPPPTAAPLRPDAGPCAALGTNAALSAAWGRPFSHLRPLCSCALPFAAPARAARCCPQQGHLVRMQTRPMRPQLRAWHCRLDQSSWPV